MDFLSLKLREWETDPKKIYLEELFYKNESMDDVKAWISDKSSIVCSAMASDRHLHLLQGIPLSARIDTHKPFSFDCNGVRVMASADFAYHLNGKVNFLNVYPDAPVESFGWALRTGILKLFATFSFSGIGERDVECKALFLKDDGISCVYWIHPLQEVVNVIKESSRVMLSRLTAKGSAHKENFTSTLFKERCKQCKYRVLCIL
jgi:hypothetical protein